MSNINNNAEEISQQIWMDMQNLTLENSQIPQEYVTLFSQNDADFEDNVNIIDEENPQLQKRVI